MEDTLFTEHCPGPAVLAGFSWRWTRQAMLNGGALTIMTCVSKILKIRQGSPLSVWRCSSWVIDLCAHTRKQRKKEATTCVYGSIEEREGTSYILYGHGLVVGVLTKLVLSVSRENKASFCYIFVKLL